ncbi:hypothetical protein IEQ34_011604 [Dendrobium chrysotoxum]|uniref:RNase H type-1 domain-containing protein n=1 Tax=Dendrobium chrysotoxum TaxID=161865 RepID=A0AAV7FKR9_DENCH|nr:hypothetical protein IEQ34_026891 [Dendrobium chrysotoxum]KAH0458790.1 hypothetical protein IEQ34_011604 [Dendrobium chrysotoxum]
MEAGWSIEHWDSSQVELQAMQYISRLLEEWMFEMVGLIIEGDNYNIIKLLLEDYKAQKAWGCRSSAETAITTSALEIK